MQALARSYRLRNMGGLWSLHERESVVYRLSYAIYCDRHSLPWGGRGYAPWWVAPLRLTKEYGDPVGFGVDFSRWVWRRRALILAEADARAYEFEPKKK